MKENIFTWESRVRDYELDSLGIVNNATYVNYLEQCRNDYARFLGVDFIAYHRKGFTLVVAGLEIQYLLPLKADDAFYVTAELSSFDDKRMHFAQTIRRKQDDKLSAKAKVRVACIDQQTGKSCMPEILREKLPVNKYVVRD